MEISRALNSTQVRSINRWAVLELIRYRGPIACSMIGRQLGLRLPTVMRIINELIKDDLVFPTGEMEASGGRKRELFTLQQNNHVVIGIDLGGTKMYGALANIGGEIIREINVNGHGTSGEESFAMLVNLIQQLLKTPLKKGQRLNGIAVGAPGITRRGDGVVEWAPGLNWRDFPLKKRLSEKFNYPIAVDNDVRLAVLGESWFGAGQGASNMVLIAIGTGVGSGIIIDGAVYRGHSEAAGEVGYLLPDCNSLNNRYDQFGALESIISGPGITQRARKYLKGTRTDEQPESLTAEDVFDAARRGEKWAKRVVAETINYLSVAVANISTLLDPELIILSGGVSKSADLLIPPILQKIEGVIPKLPRIESSKLGYRATIMGAIATTVNLMNNYYLVRNLS